MKRCCGCGEEKLLSEFWKESAAPDGYHRSCKGCARIRSSRHYRANTVARKHAARVSRLRLLYGITIEQYDALLASQGGRCAICRTRKPGGPGNFAIDHDHSCCPQKKTCGQCIRGLLCYRCNTRLSILEDPGSAIDAQRYLALCS